MSITRSRSMTRWLFLLALLGLAAGLGSCGGGGGAGPAPLTGVYVFNALTDFDGFANGRTIIGVDFGAGPIGVNIFPGDTLFFDIGAGTFFITVTYDDFSFERDQFPLDPVQVYWGDQFQVDFVY